MVCVYVTCNCHCAGDWYKCEWRQALWSTMKPEDWEAVRNVNSYR